MRQFPFRLIVQSVLPALALGGMCGCEQDADQAQKFRDPWAEKRAQLVAARQARDAIENPAAPTPRAVIEATDVPFAPLAPNAKGRQVVSIRNEGDAPLTLEPVRCSSPRLKVGLSSTEIAPGAAAEIALSYTARAGAEAFAETATLATNDPRSPELQLHAAGVVLREVALHPPSLVFERGRSDRSDELCAFVTSETWNEFEVTAAESTLEGAAWSIEPADRADLRLLHAKSGYLITFTTPEGMSHGQYQHALSLTVTPAGGEPRQIDLPVVCKVLRNVAVYGEGIASDGVIRLGVLEAGREYQRHFVVKVHDKQPDVGELNLVTYPPYVQAALVPQDTAKGNLYRLTVTIPADAPLEVRRGKRAGCVRIEFGHPRLEPLELGLEFVTHSNRLQNLTSAR